MARLKFRHLFYLLIASLPFYAFPIVNVSGIGIQADWVFMFVIILFFLLSLASGEVHLRFTGRKLFFWLFIFNIFLTFSGIRPLISGEIGKVTNFFTTWSQLAFCSLAFLIISQLRFKKATIRKGLRIYVSLAVLVAAFGLLQFILANTGQSSLFFDLPSVEYGKQVSGHRSALNIIRATSIFAEARHFGSFLITPFAILVANLSLPSSRPLFKKHRAIFLSIILASAVLVTFSSSAIFIFIVSLLLISMVTGSQSRILRFILYFAVPVVVLFVFTSIILPEFSQSIFWVFKRMSLTQYEIKNLFNFSVELGGLSRRLRGIYKSILVTMRYPFVGIGLNQLPPPAQSRFVYPPPFMLLQSIGLLGFSSFLLFVGTFVQTIDRFRRSVKGLRPELYNFATLALLFVVIALIKSCVSSHYNYPSSWFWFEMSFGSLIFFNVRCYLIRRSRT